MTADDKPQSGPLPVAVCICTYRRPAQLDRLLKSLAGIARPPDTLFVVVDNDGADPAVRESVRRFASLSGSPAEYVVERTPGIAAARNRALSTARAMNAKCVAMLDDDEWASPGWLTELLGVRAASGAQVVGGPVQPVFAVRSGRLKNYEWLWSIRKDFRGGRVFVSCTCNCLVDLAAAALLGDTPFPPEFGLTGGEDAVFFRRLHSAGVKMAWAENALLFEEIPEARAGFSWMRRRWYRQGNVGVACERVAGAPGDVPAWMKTALLLTRLPFYPLFRRDTLRLPGLWLLECERLRGRLAAHMGISYREYARM